MQPYNRRSLQELMLAFEPVSERFIADATLRLSLRPLDAANRLHGGAASFAGRNVLIRTRGQLAAVLALLALDGVAARILLCPPDVTDEQIHRIMQDGETDIIVTDADICDENSTPARQVAATPRFDTEWVLFTSGTSGVPKLVLHSLTSLTAPLRDGPSADHAVWATFYDIRRYGGLQILLRALIGGGSMVLSDVDEPVASFLIRIGKAAVTHVSGTPSHWLRALMSGAAAKITPAYVRLSGEMASQDILDRLRQTYPQARIGHAFASTEAGVAFSVYDGRAGFPATVLSAVPPRPTIRIEGGTLRVRSGAAAARYLGTPPRGLVDADGFIDTGDMVELQDDRYHVIGRREGVVNVGGLKVHPEEVEEVINRHPGVLMSRVWGRHSPIIGTLIAADVVLTPRHDGVVGDFAGIRAEIMAACRAALAPHKVPVRLTKVAEIPVMASGKIERRHA